MNHSLTLTARLERSHIPPSGGLLHLLIQVGAPAAAPGERLPLNLAAVVDRSGSMHGPKLDFTKQALLFLIDHLAPQDRLAAVTYDDHVDTPLPSQPVIHKEHLKAKLARITSGGCTNLSGGLATGMQQIAQYGREKQVNRVLLMTDGLANVGVTDPATLTGWAKTWRERGLTLSTLGVGDDFEEDLLVSLAEAGGGNFHYIADPDKLPTIFATELDGLLQISAQGLHLRLEMEPGVAIAEVIGYPPTGTSAAMAMDLPDLYSGEVKSVLLTLAVAAPPADGRLGRITLDYLPATANLAPGRAELDLLVGVTADAALLGAPPDADVTKELHLARAAIARDEAVRLSDQGDLQAGAQALETAAGALASLAEEGVAEAAEQYAALKARAEALRASQYDKAMRKQLRQESHQARQGRR